MLRELPGLSPPVRRAAPPRAVVDPAVLAERAHKALMLTMRDILSTLDNPNDMGAGLWFRENTQHLVATAPGDCDCGDPTIMDGNVPLTMCAACLDVELDRLADLFVFGVPSYGGGCFMDYVLIWSAAFMLHESRGD